MAVVIKSSSLVKNFTDMESYATEINVDPCSTQRQTERNTSIHHHTDEEVIGIITMEDVLEELIQGQIFDETDEYVDIHNRIKINLSPSLRLSSKSPGKASATPLNWRTPTASPYSSIHQTPISYHQTATTRSPLSPYTQSPIFRPSLSNSPGKSSLASPVGIVGPIYGSPSTYQVSRKSYEKLRKPDNS